jgi:hypothetical protein
MVGRKAPDCADLMEGEVLGNLKSRMVGTAFQCQSEMDQGI